MIFVDNFKYEHQYLRPQNFITTHKTLPYQILTRSSARAGLCIQLMKDDDKLLGRHNSLVIMDGLTGSYRALAWIQRCIVIVCLVMKICKGHIPDCIHNDNETPHIPTNPLRSVIVLTMMQKSSIDFGYIYLINRYWHIITKVFTLPELFVPP